MAYYLEFDGVDDYVLIPDQAIMQRTELALECEFKLLQVPSNFTTILTPLGKVGNDQASIKVSTLGNDDRLEFSFRPSSSSSRVRLFVDTGRGLLSAGGKHLLRIERTGNLVSFFLDGNFLGSGTTDFVAATTSTTIGSRGDDGGFNSAYYYVKGWDSATGGNVLFNYNKQVLVGSNDSTFTETENGDDGTLVNFPTDNSQWIYDPTIGRIEPTDYYLNGDNEPTPVVVPFNYTPTQATQGQTLVLTESVIEKMPQTQQDVFWNNVETSGGDLRLTSNQDGTGRLPLELVSIDTTARKIIIWYRLFEDFDGIGNVYLWFGKTGETQPAVADPFGRNAVWSDESKVFHMRESSGTAADNATGGAEGTYSGTLPNQGVDFGQEYTSTFPDDALDVGFAGNVSGGWYFSAKIKFDTSGRLHQIFTADTVSDRCNQFRVDADGKLRLVVFDDSESIIFNQTGTAVLSANTTYSVAFRYDPSTGYKTFVNGDVDYYNSTITPPNTTTQPSSYIGDSGVNADDSFLGQIGDAIESLLISKYTDDYIATQYANQSNQATFYGTPSIAVTDGGGAVAAEVSVLFSSLAQNTVSLEYKKYIQALISTNAELETSLSKGQEIAATLGSVTDSQLTSIKESIVETILIMNSDYNNLAEVSKSAATKLELVDSVSSVATVSKILATQNINSSIDTDLLVKCQKVLSIVVDSVGSTAVQILSDTIKEAVASIVVSSSADSSVSLLAAKTTSIVSLIISTGLLIQANKQGLTSISTGSKTTTVVVPKKGVSGSINDIHNISTSANTLKGSTVDTEVLASDTEVSNYIEVYKYVPDLIIESAASNDIIIDVGKQTATFLDSSLANSLEVNINKTLGTITIESNTELLIVTLNNFTDSNIIKIDSSIVMPASISNTTVKTPSRIIDAVIRIK